MTRIIALTAPATLGLSGPPFHEPFHGRGAHIRRPATVRNIARVRLAVNVDGTIVGKAIECQAVRNPDKVWVHD